MKMGNFGQMSKKEIPAGCAAISLSVSFIFTVSGTRHLCQHRCLMSYDICTVNVHSSAAGIQLHHPPDFCHQRI